jgi:hypothetical protein
MTLDFDLKRFNFAHWFMAVQPVLLVLLMAFRLAGYAAEAFLPMLALSAALSFFAIFFTVFSRTEGTYRGLGQRRQQLELTSDAIGPYARSRVVMGNQYANWVLPPLAGAMTSDEFDD